MDSEDASDDKVVVMLQKNENMRRVDFNN